nr:hypothetical protein BaRGS_015928 [Batillaria attramentaria]
MLDELRVDPSGQGDLQYRDVLLLCGDPRDDLAVVRALRARAVPVRVVTEESADVQNLALAVKDEVMMTKWGVASVIYDDDGDVVVVVVDDDDDDDDDDDKKKKRMMMMMMMIAMTILFTSW